MSTVLGTGALARLAMICVCFAAIFAPNAALARDARDAQTHARDVQTRKVKIVARSTLDQVLFDNNAGSWRSAPIDTGIAVKRDEDLGPAKFFTISAVLTRPPGAPRNAVAALDNGIVSDSIMPAALSDISAEPYGLQLFRAPEGMASRKWRAVEEQLRADIADIDHCRTDVESCSTEAARLVDLADRARLKNGREKLTVINSSINKAIRYQSDYSHHGVIDQWSAPLATLKEGSGDCEDYAIAKYATLRQAGIAAADVKVLLVRDVISAQDHAVTVVRHDGRWLVLDNRWSEIVDTSEASRLLPRYAMGEDGVKLFALRFASIAPLESEFDLAPASAELDADAIIWSSFSY